LTIEVTGNYILSAPPERVWELLLDAEVLRRALPGCEELVQTAPERYEGRLKVGVAAVKGTYSGQVTLHDLEAGRSLRMRFRGEGAVGFLTGEARLVLADAVEKTNVAVEGSAELGGPAAGIGNRVLGGVARLLMGQFFDNVEKVARAGGPAPRP
jgi:carbon monoxide dehydrogenase subunit G